MTFFFNQTVDRTLKSTTNPVQRDPESYGNEGILHIISNSPTGASWEIQFM